jgi:seryl-tRNA(Sec) selenium transferase
MFGRWSRRDLLKSSGAVAGAVAPVALAAAPAAAQGLPAHAVNERDNLYTRIGVRPILNARGTYTIISGSRSLPQVKQAMFEASHYHVHLDELMDGIGAELAKLTGAPWGITTNGCEAAIVQATVACMAGTDVEKAQALPLIKARDQVIIPKHSRNQYDIGVRMVGSEVVEVETADDLRRAINPRTAMIYIMSSPREAKSVLPIKAICAIANEKNIPTFVDAAAEEPVKPNIHLAAGATMVGYSGGKCLRGPQSSGMLLGPKDLCKAAYFNASPHHNYGRALKCSKEESMGLVAAVRQWYLRDHDGEQRMWRQWLEHIEARLKPLASTRFEYLQPNDLSNKSTRLRIHWDAKVLGITGTELVAKLDAGTPRIMVEGGTGTRPDAMASYITIMPYMMDPGEERIVADVLHASLSNPGPYANPPVPKGPLASLAGNWAVTIKYERGTGEQQFTLQQSGGELTGTQRGEIYQGAITGMVRANMIEMRSRMPVPGSSIDWRFKGTATGNSMAGTVDLGEYGVVPWTAVRI